MKLMAFEFRVGESIFAVEMKDVKHLFEIEKTNILTFPDMPKGLKGIVRYNNYIYPLISLREILDLPGEDRDTAFVLIYQQKEYGILIDEVIKIGEIEEKSNFLLEVFEDGDQLIEKFTLFFLKGINIPVFHNRKTFFVTKNHKNQKSFLVFKCNNELLGIEIELIRKIEEYTGENLILNGILPVVGFSKIYKKCDNKNVLVLEKDKTMGVVIGEIIDTLFVDEDKIVTANGMFDKYFLYENQEVKVFNSEYIQAKIEKFGVHLLKKQKAQISTKKEILIVEVLGVKLAIRMENILGLYEYNEAKMNISTQSKHIKGILPTGKGAVYILSLENVFNKKYNLSEESKIILLKNQDENVSKGLLVDRIDNLIEVDSNNIIEAESNNYIGGMALFEDKMIPLLNLNWPKEL